MKSISKAMIAVMIAAAMCVVPLFVIEDSDAVTITSGEKALTYEGSDVPVDKFNTLIDSTAINYYITGAVGYIPLTETPSITKVNNVKVSVGDKLSDSNGEYVKSQYLKLEIVIEGDLNANYTLFDKEDGLQDLYKYLGNSNVIASGTHIKIEGTVELSQSMLVTEDWYKTDAGKIAITKMIVDDSEKSYIDLKYTFKVGGVEKVVEVKETSIMMDKVTTTYDYDVDDKAKVVDGSKVFVTTVNDNKAEIKADYSFDGKSGSYKNVTVINDSATFNYVDADLGGTDAAPEDCYYYYDITLEPEKAMYALFTNQIVPAESTSIRTNDGMKTFLEGIGSVGDSFGTAKSIAESASSSVDEGGSSGGSNNIIFYVIIGVLAVAVVALAVLLIKKK